VFILNSVTTLAGLISIELVKNNPFSLKAFFVLSLFTFLLNFLFGAAGLFLSTIVKRPKPVTIFSIGLVLILYFVYTISKITDSVSNIGYLSPFKFVNLDVTNPAYGVDPLNLLYFAGISLLLVFLSYRLYLRRDIYT
jgi:ABC-2 type transport system permease protein